MKTLLKYALILISIWALFELNSGSLFTDIKGIFTDGPKKAINVSRYTDTVPGDYLQLLHLKQEDCVYTKTSKFYLENTVVSNLRNPISYFVYNRKYYLQIYSLSNFFTLPVDHTVKELYMSSNNFGHWSTLDDESAVSYAYPIVLPRKFTSINLKLLGKNNRIMLKNDSVAYYYSMFQKFSIQYHGQDIDELHGESKDNNLFYADLLPIEILFLKRNHNLYLLTMSVYIDGQNTPYAPGMLYKLIRNK